MRELNLFKLKHSVSSGRLFAEAISIGIPLVLYSFVLSVDLPQSLISPIRYEFSPYLLIVATLLWLIYSIPGLVGRTLSLSAILVLFGLPLATLWSTGASEAFSVGGLIPFSDAHTYYTDARRLLEGYSFTPTIFDQRPLSTGGLAAVLALVQQNLQWTQAVLVAIVATSCFFTVREIQQDKGALPSALITLGVFLFYRVFAGSVMSENWGLPLGFLGFACLWRGARQIQQTYVLLGLLLLSLGMLARPSAIFVLPTLLLWGAIVFRRTKRFSWRFFIAGIASILLAFILGSITRKFLAPESISFSNFAYTLYGTVTHTDWYQVFRDYPQLGNLSAQEVSQTAYKLAFQRIQENPTALITGLTQMAKDFFFGPNYSMFFVYRPKDWLNTVLVVLSGVGLLVCCRNWRDPKAQLVLAFFLGVVISIPLLPIRDAGLRPYATVLTIFYLLPALGFNFLVRIIASLVRRIGISHQQALTMPPVLRGFLLRPLPENSPVLGLTGLLLASFIFFTPLLIKITGHPPNYAAYTCPAGLETQYFRANPGSFINLAGKRRIPDSHLPNIRIVDFKKGIELLKYEPSAWNSLSSLEGRVTIVDALNNVWLVAKPGVVPKPGRPVVACGKSEKFAGTYGNMTLFHAETIQPVP